MTDAVARLGRRPLTFVGDSLSNQLWAASALAHKQVFGSGSQWPDLHQWFCVPETHAALQTLLERSGLLAPSVAGGGEGGVLVINFGMWYNRAEIACPCEPDTNEAHCVDEPGEVMGRATLRATGTGG